MTERLELPHTPGPWRAHVMGDGYLIKQAAGHGDARVAGLRMGDEDRGYANALLIAAAPEMLDALKARRLACEMAAAISAATPDGETPAKQQMDEVSALFAKAEKLEIAAIAKAEGRT